MYSRDSLHISSRSIDPEATRDGDLQREVVVELHSLIEQSNNLLPDLRRGPPSIFPFPDRFLPGVEEGIRQPQSASFGPYYKGRDHLLLFEQHKTNFLNKFLQRTGIGSQHDLVQKLSSLEMSTRECYDRYSIESMYSPESVNSPESMSSEEFVNMMVLDGSFIVELFLQYGGQVLPNARPLYNPTLIADLLKLGNQLPFFVLEELCTYVKPDDQALPKTAFRMLAFRKLALRFLCKALDRPLETFGRQPMHLLDLLRRSLLPASPPESNCKDFPDSIPCADHLCSFGISLMRRSAKSFLEINFRKIQIPPFALKIPPVTIDNITSTILVNCVALEYNLHYTYKYFTAYVLFMHCLVKDHKDLGFLREANIVTHIDHRDGDEYLVNLLNSLRGNRRFFNDGLLNNYLCKQYHEINSNYRSFGAIIWSNLARYNTLTLLVPVLAAIIALFAWLFPWLLPNTPPNSPCHSGKAQ